MPQAVLSLKAAAGVSIDVATKVLTSATTLAFYDQWLGNGQLEDRHLPFRLAK